MSAPASETEATFGFVDLAGFTALTEAHGDSEAVALLDQFEAIANDALALGDRLVKTIGDAVMVVFPRPDAAVAALTRLFVALAETELPVARAGLHHGPAIERGGDYLGASVNLTARVAAQAHGGQVLATAEAAGDLPKRLPQRCARRDAETTQDEARQLVARGRDAFESDAILRHAAKSIMADIGEAAKNLEDLADEIATTGSLEPLDGLADSHRSNRLGGHPIRTSVHLSGCV